MFCIGLFDEILLNTSYKQIYSTFLVNASKTQQNLNIEK